MPDYNPQDELVTITTVYTNHWDGTVSERVTCGEIVLYEGPARVVFAEFVTDAWPWESKNGDQN